MLCGWFAARWNQSTAQSQPAYVLAAMAGCNTILLSRMIILLLLRQQRAANKSWTRKVCEAQDVDFIDERNSTYCLLSRLQCTKNNLVLVAGFSHSSKKLLSLKKARCCAGNKGRQTRAAGASSGRPRMWTSSTTAMPTSTARLTALSPPTPMRSVQTWSAVLLFQSGDLQVLAPRPFPPSLPPSPGRPLVLGALTSVLTV